VQLNLVVQIKNHLDSVFIQYLNNTQVPGIAIGVLKNGKVLYSKGFGVKNNNTQEPVTSKSLFHMASVSKTFVATAIMQLYEDNKIKLDDPLIKYLPYLEMKGEQYRGITIRQVLTHTSGIPDVQNYYWDKPQYDNAALEGYVRSLKKKKLDFDPDKQFQYSNAAFEVLGDLIAKVSNMPFEDYIKANILDPIQMGNSTFLKTEVLDSLATSPHIKSKNEVVMSKVYPYNRMHAPSSTLPSNIDDMLKYAIHI